ncbi:MAG: cytochrome c [Candidatus Sericytochromatia bacterium]|nr:cytochrome c [Candidatus Sericytochromatia bacterium]
MTALRVLLPLTLALSACGAPATLRGSQVATLRAKQQAPSFQKEVAPLLKSNCASCHNAGRLFAPLPMFEKDGTPRTEAIRSNIDRIVGAIESGRMPPRRPGSVTPDQIALLKAWAAAGTPID